MSVIKAIIVIVAVFTCPPVGFLLAWIFNGCNNSDSCWANVGYVNRDAEKQIKDTWNSLKEAKQTHQPGAVGHSSSPSYNDGGIRAFERHVMSGRDF